MRQYLVLYAKYLDTSLAGAGESIKVVLKRDNQDDDDKHDEDGSDHQNLTERHQIYRLKILVANAQKVSAVRSE
ncbi:hypothetical protein SLEP1_g52071 [Rubroshorea leprosula]|uniref:Uncharacterized protein n=1 Tax=Rubroshorea leprosula TaxID=152421 RepID=A0AAV5M8V5_9ROSI|nr:hypothetical protein SLEP1_g52071 [Rubroshorea leprosula]